MSAPPPAALPPTTKPTVPARIHRSDLLDDDIEVNAQLYFDDQLLHAQLAERGLHAVDPPGGQFGWCFYRALALVVGNGATEDSIHAATIRWIQANQDEAAAFLPGLVLIHRLGCTCTDDLFQGFETIEQYLARHQRRGQFADNLAMFAALRATNVALTVLDNVVRDTPARVLLNDQPGARHLVIGYLRDQQHYVAALEGPDRNDSLKPSDGEEEIEVDLQRGVTRAAPVTPTPPAPAHASPAGAPSANRLTASSMMKLIAAGELSPLPRSARRRGPYDRNDFYE